MTGSGLKIPDLTNDISCGESSRSKSRPQEFIKKMSVFLFAEMRHKIGRHLNCYVCHVCQTNVKIKDYTQGKVYKLHCKDINDVYVGSTVLTLEKRLRNHMIDKSRKKYKLYEYMSRHEDWQITLLENSPCTSETELRKREQYWMDKLQPSLNVSNAYSSKMTHLKKKRLWAKRLWANGQKVVCPCGSTLNQVGLRKHRKTKKHLRFQTNSSQSSQSFQSSSRVPPAQKQDKKRKLQNDAPKPSTVKRQAIPDDVVDALKLTKVWGC